MQEIVGARIYLLVKRIFTNNGVHVVYGIICNRIILIEALGRIRALARTSVIVITGYAQILAILL